MVGDIGTDVYREGVPLCFSPLAVENENTLMRRKRVALNPDVFDIHIVDTDTYILQNL